MIPKDVLKKIRRIQITTSRLATDVFAGQYRSVFKGRGMEFYEVREYIPGDEIRAIDWNVTARMGHPYVKKFIEERELTVMLLLDASMSCCFGTKKQLKKHLAAEVSSVLAFSAIQNNDKIGLIIFTDKIEKFIPPRKGSRHVLRVIREALYYKVEGAGTDIKLVLEYLNRILKRRAIVFLISDFFDSGFEKTLAILHKRHDIICVTITDPMEKDIPDAGIINMVDSETRELLLIDTHSRSFRTEFKNILGRRLESRKKLINSLKLDNIELQTDAPYQKELMKFFRIRERKLSY